LLGHFAALTAWQRRVSHGAPAFEIGSRRSNG
jgi:hypothetical protein